MPLIRRERSGDFEPVHALLLAAFGREAQARLVDRLRASGKIATALVAEENDRILDTLCSRGLWRVLRAAR